ncbi:hypothetical protein PQX77_020125 [Marasmius sp. AFHP31]|nr:hypothetical protein PQX77_020125 [Marasmius sp. AFHP31]
MTRLLHTWPVQCAQIRFKIDPLFMNNSSKSRPTPIYQTRPDELGNAVTEDATQANTTKANMTGGNDGVIITNSNSPAFKEANLGQ